MPVRVEWRPHSLELANAHYPRITEPLQPMSLTLANFNYALPPELMRKGRFDDTFFVDLPDLAVRAEVLTIHLRASGRDEQRFDIDQLAQAADRLTGAEIEQAVVEALSISFAEGRELLQDDLLAVLSNTVPFVETYEQQVKELREWARRRCRPASRDRSLRELYLSARSSRDQPDLGRRP